MLYQLANKNFCLTLSNHGAELQSLHNSKTGEDYIFTGPADIWKFHAPVLFPHCGKIKDGFVLIDGQKCGLKSNGFARDSEFILFSQDESSASFVLEQNNDTLKLFPYNFRLIVRYELLETGVRFTSTVINTDYKPFLFSLGSHSAFKCPRNDGETISDYQLEFEKKEPLIGIRCEENGFLSKDKTGNPCVLYDYGESEPGIIPLNNKGFGNGQLFTKFSSKWVGLRNKKDGSIIKVNTMDYPYLMIWQNMGDPAFVCIEPWYGLPDSDETNHQWRNKPGLVELQPGASFTSDQSITICER